MSNTYRMERTDGQVREIRSSQFADHVAERYARYNAVRVLDVDMEPGGAFVGIYGARPISTFDYYHPPWTSDDDRLVATWENERADQLDLKRQYGAAHAMRLRAATRLLNGYQKLTLTDELRASAERSRAVNGRHG